MGGACGTYDRKDKCIQGLVGKLKRYCSEDLGVDGKTKKDKSKIK